MKKIIKGAFTKFEAECLICGCEFEYGMDDISRDEEGDPMVDCPACGGLAYHITYRGVEESRKEVKSDEDEDEDDNWVGEGHCSCCNSFEIKRLYPYIRDGGTHLVCKDCLDYVKTHGWYRV